MSDRKIIFKYIKDKDYKRIHATGVMGGINSFGELNFDIIEEVSKGPEKIEMLIKDDQIIEENNFFENEDPEVVNRIRHAGITMPMNVVPSIIKWLQQKVENHQKTIEDNNLDK